MDWLPTPNFLGSYWMLPYISGFFTYHFFHSFFQVSLLSNWLLNISYSTFQRGATTLRDAKNPLHRAFFQEMILVLKIVEFYKKKST